MNELIVSNQNFFSSPLTIALSWCVGKKSMQSFFSSSPSSHFSSSFYVAFDMGLLRRLKDSDDDVLAGRQRDS